MLEEADDVESDFSLLVGILEWSSKVSCSACFVLSWQPVSTLSVGMLGESDACFGCVEGDCAPGIGFGSSLIVGKLG